MESIAVGNVRRNWHTKNPLVTAYLDEWHDEWVKNFKPFLGDERNLLGVTQEATKRDVRNTYRRLARKLHPDVGGDAEAFKQLHEAYRRVLAATKA